MECVTLNMNNKDIVTTSEVVGVGNPITGGSANAPERRKSIWD